MNICDSMNWNEWLETRKENDQKNDTQKIMVF